MTSQFLTWFTKSWYCAQAGIRIHFPDLLLLLRGCTPRLFNTIAFTKQHRWSTIYHKVWSNRSSL